MRFCVKLLAGTGAEFFDSATIDFDLRLNPLSVLSVVTLKFKRLRDN